MALDFQIEPFFDDYSEDKKFHRILFRPGYAVQARELTQLQTILQEQIRRHGDHIFKEGSMVIPGQISFDLELSFIKLQFAPDVDASTTLKGLVGKEISNDSGLLAKVVSYSVAEGEDLNTLFVKYQNSVDVEGINTTEFAPLETLTPVDGSSGLDVVVADTFMPVGKASSANIQRGIYYIKNNFVLVSEQFIILDKYSATPSYRIGLQAVEEIIYPETDETLLDNALGSPNYSAPGAARYKMDLQLTKMGLEETTGDGFIDLLMLRDGQVIYKIDRSTYAEIEKTLARRTYDESGDYTVRPFRIQNREYRNNLRGDWAAAEKFIQGDLIKVPDGSGVGFYYFVATTTGITSSTRPNFDPYADNVVDNQITWEYVIYPSFNQGIFTFTAGDTAYSAFTVNDHLRLDGMLAIGIEAGKAYVRGYEIEKISTEYIPVQKARYLPEGSDALCSYFGLAAGSLPAVNDQVSGYKTANIDVSTGAYIVVNNVKYLPDIKTLPYISLHSVNVASAGTLENIIGKARIRAIEKHTDTSYKLFVFDIAMNAGKEFKDVKSIFTAVNEFSADVVQQNNLTTLQDPDKSSLIYRLPDYAIHDISELTYSVVVSFTETASGGTGGTDASATIVAPTGYTFESVYDSDNYIITDETDGSILNPTLEVISDGTALVITGVEAHELTILATLKRADATAAESKRTVTEAPEQQITSQAVAQASTITLNHSYVTRIISVLTDDRGFVVDGAPNLVPTYNKNITDRFIFNDGQNKNSIGLSTLSLDPTATKPEGPIKIQYEYLASVDGPGDVISVDSYTHSTSRMRYDQIIGVEGIPLRDAIDFRPYASGGAYVEKYFPKFGTTASVKYRHHLARIDDLALSSNGSFVISRGIPSEIPSEPTIPSDSMKLASIELEPYTFFRDSQSGISITRTENKRYTMRDIGKLERRIQDLEYYTALSLTEMDTKNLRITDSQGFDRFQNGFLVDSFNGQGVGNASSDDWNASIDTEKKELRPFVNQRQLSLLENVNAQTRNYKVSGDIVTLPFTETVLINQPLSSVKENINPYQLQSWKGIVSINPWSDTWFSTHYRPDIVLTDESQYQAIVSKAKQDGILGTVYNATIITKDTANAKTTKEMVSLGKWSEANTKLMNTGNNGGSFWRDRRTFTIEELDFIGNTNHNISSAQANSVAGSRVVTYDVVAVPLWKTMTGTNTTVVEKFDSRIAEERIIDHQVIPYIRPRAVLFTGFGFKPGTDLYAFFDNIMVNDYIKPASRILVTKINKPNSTTTYYPSKFDVERNAGSAVSNAERTVYSNDGVQITGTVHIANGSKELYGTGTSFSSEVNIGDIINFGGNIKYEVEAYDVLTLPGGATQNSNTKLYLKTAWTGTTIPDTEEVSVKVIGPKHTNEEVEIAFNHGEVIREYVNGVATGNTAIVVGQEIHEGSLYLFIMNMKGSGNLSTAANAYFEGEYLDPTTGEKPRVKYVSGSTATKLTSSPTGQLAGIFKIPASPLLKFKTGRRELRFSDKPYAIEKPDEQFTSGRAIYEATGTLEIRERTIISTRTADLQSVPISTTVSGGTSIGKEQSGDTGWFDPLAQTFLVEQKGGAFITSVDLFFATKDEKFPVRIEIREVVNGYPGRVVLPFSRVEKKAGDVKISDNASVATTFNFVSPVFLQDQTEYALVVLSDSTAYNMWISQTATNDVTTGKAITSQPYNGVLFKSQNASAWTADQTQDMKFTIRRAQFSSAPVTIELIPPKITYKKLKFNPIYLVEGTRKARISHPDHGMVPGDTVILKCEQIFSSINGISTSNIFNTPLEILTADLDSYVVQFGGTVNSNATGVSGGGYVSASENFEFHTCQLDSTEIVPTGTSISYTIKTIDHSDAASSSSISNRTVKDFDSTRVYASENNYQSSSFPSGLSVFATLNSAVDNNAISPVIDLSRVALTIIGNKIDNPGVEINDTSLDYKIMAATATIGDGKDIQLIDSTGGVNNNTIVIDGVNEPELFRNFNNSLNIGNMLKLVYLGETNATNYFTIVDKKQTAEGKLFLQLEAFNTTSELKDTGVDQTVSITWLARFRNEYAPIGGSTHSKYVTKKINFARPSEMLKIMFSAMIPPEAEVDIYYKTGISVDGDFISSRYYKALPDAAYNKSASDFSDITATIEDLAPFDSVMVKLVMRSINKAKVPRIKDFRVIACAA